MEPGQGVAVQDHEVGGHLPGYSDPVSHKLLVHVEQYVVCIPSNKKLEIFGTNYLNVLQNHFIRGLSCHARQVLRLLNHTSRQMDKQRASRASQVADPDGHHINGL